MMTLCDQTTVFGMGGGQRPDDFPYHYYEWMETERSEGNDSHSFGAEEALIHTLAAYKKKITLCNITGCFGYRSPLPEHKPLIKKLPFVDHLHEKGISR